MTLPDGPYFYFATKSVTRPTLVEACAQYISEVGEEGWRPLSMYPGRFVPLVEAPQIDEAAPIAPAPESC